jgi:hypothetical protein
VSARWFARVSVGHDLDFVVIPRRAQITATGFGHGQQDAMVVFKIPVPESRLPAEVHASNLHPDQIVRVVDHAHLVGFGVTGANAGDGWRHSESSW